MDVDTRPDAPEKPPRAKRLKKFERRKDPKPRRPTKRSDRILLLLSNYRLCSRTQIAEQLGYEGYSPNETRRLITDLFHLNMVDKPEKQQLHQERRGQGTLPDVIALGNNGAALLERDFGIPRSAARWRDKNRDVGATHIEHTLLASEVMLAFERACIRRKDVRMIYPREILQDTSFAVQGERRPFQWQVETSWQGIKLRIAANPDYPFGLEFLSGPPGRSKVWFFLEADRGTETVKPENLKKATKPNLFHKYLAYDGTRQQKLHTARYGWGGFRVLTVTAKSGLQYARDPETGDLIARTRVMNLQEAATLAAPDAPPGFFLFADLKSLKEHDDVLRMPWQTADPAKRAVLELKSAAQKAAS